jgi:hypothetical protein
MGRQGTPVVNNLRMLRIACALAAASLALGGCGGGSDKPPHRQVPATRLSARDRVAYYQIATTSGLLRARASSVLSGVHGMTRQTLAAGRERLDLLRPESAALARLRNRLRAAIDTLLRDESPSAARRAMKASTAVNQGLKRFGKGKAVGELVPD